MSKYLKEALDWLKAIVSAIVVVLFISIFLTPMTVYSISMNPTLVEKDVVIIDKISELNRGDIVSFKSNLVLSEHDVAKLSPIQKLLSGKGSQMLLIKRIIGIPGDSVTINGGEVFINGIKQNEPYIGSYTTGSVHIDKIPEGAYFLVGDNRSHSTDSRNAVVGLIHKDEIVGKVMVRVYPLNKLGTVE